MLRGLTFPTLYITGILQEGFDLHVAIQSLLTVDFYLRYFA